MAHCGAAIKTAANTLHFTPAGCCEIIKRLIQTGFNWRSSQGLSLARLAAMPYTDGAMLDEGWVHLFATDARAPPPGLLGGARSSQSVLAQKKLVPAAHLASGNIDGSSAFYLSRPLRWHGDCRRQCGRRVRGKLTG
jgi:hypothetical protein